MDLQRRIDKKIYMNENKILNLINLSELLVKAFTISTCINSVLFYFFKKNSFVRCAEFYGIDERYFSGNDVFAEYMEPLIVSLIFLLVFGCLLSKGKEERTSVDKISVRWDFVFWALFIGYKIVESYYEIEEQWPGKAWCNTILVSFTVSGILTGIKMIRTKIDAKKENTNDFQYKKVFWKWLRIGTYCACFCFACVNLVKGIRNIVCDIPMKNITEARKTYEIVKWNDKENKAIIAEYNGNYVLMDCTVYFENQEVQTCITVDTIEGDHLKIFNKNFILSDCEGKTIQKMNFEDVEVVLDETKICNISD